MYPEYAVKYNEMLDNNYEKIIKPLIKWGLSSINLDIPKYKDSLEFLSEKNPLIDMTQNINQLIKKFE